MNLFLLKVLLTLKTLEPREIPIAFVILHNRITKNDGSIKIKSPQKFDKNDAQKYTVEANEILEKTGFKLMLTEGKEIYHDTIDNNNDVIDYTVGGSSLPPELAAIKESNTSYDLRTRGELPIFIVNKLSNSGLPTTDEDGNPQGPLGISFNRDFISILSLVPPPGVPLNPGRNLAHEIGHAYFGLRHPFEQFRPQFKQGDDKYNLMDYNQEGTQRYFRAYQFNTFNYFTINAN